MREVDRRLAALPAEKRRLAELRLKQAGLGERLEDAGPREEILPGFAPPPATSAGLSPAPMAFSLFFFSADGSAPEPKPYRLLLAAARFADQQPFTAVWTPERHFQDFGGLYPNPGLLAASLAVTTSRIQIRAGSAVLPLHHPVRLAEDWAVIDNLSGGRAALACATGWHPDDFVIAPHNYERRREITVQTIHTLRRLWAGEEVVFPGGDGREVAVRTLPRPVQAELPLWVTSSGNPETWELAGSLGANVLSSFGGQPPAELQKKIRLYRRARQEAGLDPRTGTVSLMLHTFLGDDLAAVKERAREPLSDYLRTHLRQRDSFLEIEGITAADKEALIPMAFEHYVRSASLIGTVESASAVVHQLASLGVDEAACLVDFGLAHGEVMESLDLLAQLAERHALPAASREEAR